jgi:hypothetical protein
MMTCADVEFYWLAGRAKRHVKVTVWQSLAGELGQSFIRPPLLDMGWLDIWDLCTECIYEQCKHSTK